MACCLAGFRHEWTRGWPTQQAAGIDRLEECARFNLTLIQTYVYLDAFVDQRAAMRVSVAPRAGL